MANTTATASTPLQTTSLIEGDLAMDEGVRGRPYRDTAGHLTIGVGHNLDASPLCNEAILAQLRFDISEALKVLDVVVPGWSSHPEPVQRALTNLAFNLGAKLAQFGTFLALVKTRNYKAAGEDLLSTLWAKQVGDRSKRVAKLLSSAV